MDRASAILGLQVTFLTFAVALLAAPVDKYVTSQWEWAQEIDLGRMMIFVLAGIVLLAFSPLRHRCAALLAVPIARGTYREIATAVVLLVLVNYAVFGAFALWNWSAGGEPRLARVMGGIGDSAEMDRALSIRGIAFFAMLAATTAPILEELVFRGFLYAAWRDAFGWVFGSLATAVVFGLFHGTFWPQFLGSLVFVCVFRKSASLRGAIYVHAANNFLLWYPILGQFMLPSNRSTGELHLWTFHLICLAAVVVLLPWYMWTARDARLPGK